MSTTARLLRSSNPLRPIVSAPSASSSFSQLKCSAKAAGLGGEKVVVSGGSGHSWDGDGLEVRKPTVSVKTATTQNFLIAADPIVATVGGGVDIIKTASILVLMVRDALVKVLRRPAAVKLKKLNVQMSIERALIDCRFFTLFAVVGSLLGSVLCFVEGCFFILESYLHYFNSLSGGSDQGHHVVQLLIEAIDMFLVGTAMLIFGVGIYVMFVGSKHSKGKEAWLPGSNLFGLFHFRSLPAWVDMQSVTQAKSKIGHAVLMILQVGLLEKFKHIPLVTCLDLACFGGAVLVSSACLFLLSRLNFCRRRINMEGR